jgi:hypothetical protein
MDYGFVKTGLLTLNGFVRCNFHNQSGAKVQQVQKRYAMRAVYDMYATGLFLLYLISVIC